MVTGRERRARRRDVDQDSPVVAVAAGFARSPVPEPPVTGVLSRYALVLPGRCSLPGRCWVPDRTATR